MKASAIEGIVIQSDETLPDGVGVITTACVDYEALTKLPMVIEYCNELYGRTGWNSDRSIAYYRTDAKIAFRKERS